MHDQYLRNATTLLGLRTPTGTAHAHTGDPSRTPMRHQAEDHISSPASVSSRGVTHGAIASGLQGTDPTPRLWTVHGVGQGSGGALAADLSKSWAAGMEGGQGRDAGTAARRCPTIATHRSAQWGGMGASGPAGEVTIPGR